MERYETPRELSLASSSPANAVAFREGAVVFLALSSPSSRRTRWSQASSLVSCFEKATIDNTELSYKHVSSTNAPSHSLCERKKTVSSASTVDQKRRRGLTILVLAAVLLLLLIGIDIKSYPLPLPESTTATVRAELLGDDAEETNEVLVVGLLLLSKLHATLQILFGILLLSVLLRERSARKEGSRSRGATNEPLNELILRLLELLLEDSLRQSEGVSFVDAR